MTLDELLQGRCARIKRGDPVLPASDIHDLHTLLPEWQVVDDGTRLRRRYRFAGFSAATDFAVRLAPLANGEDHHPDLHLTMYRWLEVEYRTNIVGGLTLNDFIMAAKTDQLYAEAIDPAGS